MLSPRDDRVPGECAAAANPAGFRRAYRITRSVQAPAQEDGSGQPSGNETVVGGSPAASVNSRMAVIRA